MLKRARLLCYLVLCVSRAVLSAVLGAWSVRFVGWAAWVDCRCLLSFVFLGVARRLELSPCNTQLDLKENETSHQCAGRVQSIPVLVCAGAPRKPSSARGTHSNICRLTAIVNLGMDGGSPRSRQQRARC